MLAIRNVLFLTAEDGVADTVRPRLDANDGDPRRVSVIEAVKQRKGVRPFSLARDLEALESAIVRTNACAVIIDPLSAYIGTTDSYRDAEVRQLLAPLAALAERTAVAILGIVHLTKNSERGAMQRSLGSIAWVAAARSVLAIGKDPGDRDRRLLMAVKLNIAAKPPALAFRIDPSRSAVVWEPEPVEGVDPDYVLSGGGTPEDRFKRQLAVEFVQDFLGARQESSNAIYDAAKANGFTKSQTYRALAQVATPVKAGFGDTGEWSWRLKNRNLKTS